MYIELIDLLRCPRDHAESWLVAAFRSMDGRVVLEGKLGCPICFSSFPIEGGVADLRVAGASDYDFIAESFAPQHDEAVRAAALMGLVKPGSLVVLSGESARLAQKVSELTEARVIAFNPAMAVAESERVAVVLSNMRFPFASGSVDGIILNESTCAFVTDAARILRPGGRIVTPLDSLPPGNFRELARDDMVAVFELAGPLIPLSR